MMSPSTEPPTPEVEKPKADYPKIPIAKAPVKTKIIVELWDVEHDRPKFIKSRKVSYGAEYARIKVGKDKRYYKINYQQLKEGKKFYIYMTDVHNSVGSISFTPYEKERVEPYQADLILDLGLSETFVKAKTYPLWYILIGLVGMVIALAILAWLFPAYLNIQQLAQLQDQQINLLNAQVKSLNSQLAQLGVHNAPAVTK